MASYKWNIDVTCFADRFAIIQRLQNSQQARVLLDMASNGIHIARAYMPWCFAPRLEGSACSSYSSIDIGAISRGNFCQLLTSRRIDALNILTTGRLHPLIIYEQAERLMLFNPGQSWSSGFRCRPILHRFKNFHHIHSEPPCLNHWVVMRRCVVTSGEVRKLPFNV